MIEINNGKIQIVKKSKPEIFSRQSAPKVYDMNASIHIRLRNTLLKQKSLKTKFNYHDFKFSISSIMSLGRLLENSIYLSLIG